MDRLAANVIYDSASAYEWRDLNETTFLERVFAELKLLMGETFMRYSFFILAAPDSQVRPHSVSDTSPRKVLIWLSNESSSVPTELHAYYRAIFKHHLPRELPGTTAFPFNIGYVRDVKRYAVTPVEDRAINVFFSGNLNPNRLRLYRALHPTYRRLPEAAFRAVCSLSARGVLHGLMPTDLSNALPDSFLHFTDGFKRGLSPAEYGQRLADSRIALCPRGFESPETFRHMEAMRAGAVVISEPLPDTHYYRDSPIVIVSKWEAGIELIRQLLGDERHLKAIQAQTIIWWRDVCSEPATARYMYSKLREAGAGRASARGT